MVRSNTMQLPKEKNPAVQRIADMLVKAFDEIGEKIRADLLKAYRENAEYWHKKFLETSESQSGPIFPKDERGRRTGWFVEWYRYTELSKKKDEYPTPTIKDWEDVRKLKNRLKITYKYAEQRANESYENARDSFVHKNLDKMREVLGNRTDLKSAVIKFDWVNRSYFRGNLQVYLDGANFRGDVDVKYVVRTIPRVTPYFQYPLVFVEAEVGGKLYARPSELELRNLLSGKTDEQHAQEKAAQAVAEGWCPGGGKQVPPAVWSKIYMRMSKYATCPDCGQGASCPHGKFLKHKTKAAVKASEEQKLVDAGYCPMSKGVVPFPLIEKFIRSFTVYPQEGPRQQYSYSIFDAVGKYRKLPCPKCGQNVVVSDSRDGLTPQDVKATYQKHKIKK